MRLEARLHRDGEAKMEQPINTLAEDNSISGQVLRKILAAVFDARYGPGFRLPAERELAGQLGASRVSVRQALQRLRQYGVIMIKQGSGAVVQPQRMWTAGVITHLLQHLLEKAQFERMFPVISDAFAVRRQLLLDVVRRAAGRLAAGDLDPARTQLKATWQLRDDIYRFAISDREVINRALEIAGLRASMWTLNALSEPYLGLVGMVSAFATLRIPESYVPAHLAVFAAQEAGDGETAYRRMKSFMDELDLAIVASLPAELGEIPPEVLGIQTE
jgi:DNA-binding FadR family transcriptional regulator